MTTHARPIGLICAVPEEISHFGAHLQVTAVTELAGFRFLAGDMDGVPVVLVEAGIGKVNAAIVGTLLAQHFAVRALVFSGVAGGLDPDLGIGDVVIARTLIQHDYGAFCDGRLTPYQPGVPPLPGLEGPVGYHLPAGLEGRIAAVLAGLELPAMPATATGGQARQPATRFGTVLTGDYFLNCAATRADLHDRFQAQAVEMEGAALAQLAERFGLPLVVVRALSDLAGGDSHVDFPSFARAAAGGAALIVRRLIALFAEKSATRD
ncbi:MULTISPECIES: 5'-methylthioadenosine/adenosylhomocysteine nucleosidase [unclassified Azospirillum]|uniref:5'-methylthioadenosine/adenosylhomocysteine nucleosidase n=1 Tax=unclassified Azospirillum TaxID=2630922 RepID=UPI000B6D41F8|nr:MULTISPECIES: 5'-methylthioadenosine/adenosylhomocysteine nucleosidase [unclassified Azospirillum]SNS39592.1 adenosylhomocysteine nucleosidase [Azospirillum sp. RU38E]SNS57993.1 adenosylhomocysteine nucleosidase [Azospirillum sp. RU37A]